MSRSTDVGGVERRDSPPSLLLYNFDIDGDRLKLEHQEILRTVAVPISPWRQCHYCRLGKPYGIGNQRLSEGRARNTLRFLRGEVKSLFPVRAIIGFGERKAKQEGYRDNTEDERFRSVVVFLSHSPVPPPPIDMDLGDNIDDTIRVITQITDIVGGVTMLSIFLEGLLATVLDLLGLFAAFIGAILALPGIWLKVDQIVHFNGRAQGMWNAFQDMADQFRDPSLTYARSRHGPPPAGHSRAIARCRRSSS